VCNAGNFDTNIRTSSRSKPVQALIPRELLHHPLPVGRD